MPPRGGSCCETTRGFSQTRRQRLYGHGWLTAGVLRLSPSTISSAAFASTPYTPACIDCHQIDCPSPSTSLLTISKYTCNHEQSVKEIYIGRRCMQQYRTNVQPAARSRRTPPLPTTALTAHHTRLRPQSESIMRLRSLVESYPSPLTVLAAAAADKVWISGTVASKQPPTSAAAKSIFVHAKSFSTFSSCLKQDSSF